MNTSLRLALEEIAAYVITAEDGSGIGKAELFAIVASQQKVIANQQEVSGRLLGPSNATMPKTTENRTKKNSDTNGSGMTPSVNPVPFAPRRSSRKLFAAPQVRTSTNPGNPTQRHSPARLILRCTPPISIEKRRDAAAVCTEANKVLAQAQPTTTIRVALASYTDRGNITLVVTGKSKSEDLMPYAAAIGNAIAPGHAVKPSNDTPWYKVIVHAASTCNTHGDPILTAEQFTEEIFDSNYWLTESAVRLADGCRFLAAPKELKNKTHAAFVMTFEKLEDAKFLVKDQGGLYFSGKWCRADKFEDRQQVRQCERCLSLLHGTKSCRERIRCRYCKGDHESWKHSCTEASCGAKGPCPHSQCVNCPETLTGDKCHSADDRRCPEKLRVQGLATDSRAAKQRSKATTKRIDDEPEQAGGAKAKPKITAIQRTAIELLIISVPELMESKAFELLVEAKGSTETALKLAKGEPPELEDEVMDDESTTQSAPKAQPTLNVYRCPRLTRALLHTKRNEFDIALFQEPAWTRIAGGKKGPVAHPNWRPVIPCEIGKNEQPGVMAYLNAEPKDFRIAMRTDLLESKCGQILEIRQAGHRAVLLVNLYNVPAASAAGEWIVEKLPEIEWPQNMAIILTGDWNLHHEWWEEKRGGSNRMSRNTVEWLREADFMLMNEPDVPTFFGQGNEARTTIDLTFINTEANDNDIVKEWAVDRGLANTSDHAAIRWVIDQGAIPVDTTPNSRYNFKKADVATFKASLREELDKCHTLFEKLAVPESIEKVEDVEEATIALMRSLEEATRKAVPLRKPSRYSKDYWTDELDDLLKAAHDAADDAREDKRVRGWISEEASKDVTAKRKKFKRRVKAVAAKAANDKLEAADPNEVWKFKRWTQGKREYPSPAFHPRGGGPKVVQHQEKCDLLLKELLPEPQDDTETEMPDLSAPRPDEYKLPAITRGK
ncbi:hypothetical protein M407DRAFT_28172 [Tulasnella calospora MUT 4182]|uniref:Endonuclease/exonuclease/phosphatase domain-containing protein n=1 Tax=Tulasnella calospora MUT 4182 TaxID=1051891 RepID=A0A0C3LLS9_9AGAM|nr:hypothetical protein M407DRAFT_28172 [Tulasnella calospora MUT 4182]